MKYSGPDPQRRHDSLISADEGLSMFNEIAGFYDRTNKILSLGLDGYWRRVAVRTLDPQPGRVYLDVGCGTGDVSLAIATHSHAMGRVIGIDPSEGMLRRGIEKVARKGLQESISMLRGDVLNLQFPDASFDGAIAAFCIRNVTDRKRALSEIHRVLRPGGLFVILELIEPDGPLMKPLFRLYSKVVMPIITGLMSSIPAYRYLSDSMAEFPRPGVWAQLMSDAGFSETGSRPLTGGIARIFTGKVPIA
ncbi:bifunctional demethylmenaquinone methyltransferase/2-methoxy-6-polyprenyl-1,4-benzoquinol methylase UbiE [Desulfomonile tiedjei]|uniref:Demethylmenaquinone methyltransferase n=1 Tax=Desulfomonile tiedjei (strain ATCC 49306 / DSM 6799 / DCB-1) TaxID=706587 RepID=I4C6U8_DESTA|nr:bifunctional demethylmenaquinone methyltransferase/2-methoxy-6-polyprenyl-1,4-benzoquinol methylase UbiE [Desulfomonile tiedjei]AFM25289.1 ubiquinone/menaquinone biosynthesis methyltransferase [Desulfomonile tiedjei DSM 6799]